MKLNKTDLEKQIDEKRSRANLFDVIADAKIAMAIIAAGIAAFPIVLKYCRSANGYINIPLMLTINILIVGPPVLFIIYKIWKT